MPRRASRTAALAALARASACLEPREIRAQDHLARRFVDGRMRWLRLPLLRRVALHAYTRRLPGAYGLVIARTRRIDEFVQAELAAGAAQLVVLGAGYDSRAYRFQDALAGRPVFEVDAPAILERKRARVTRILGEPPANVRYVPIDFDRETVEGPLLAAGYDPARRSVFVWEGVTFYLTAEAVERVLRLVATRSGPESAIVFDYLFRSVVDGSSQAFGAKKSLEFVRRRGEPFTFGLEERALQPRLADLGLRLESNLLPDEIEARYLDPYAKQSHVYRVGGFYGIATARVS